MAKEQHTALIVNSDSIAWTTMSGGGERVSVQTAGACQLVSLSVESDEERAEAQEARAQQIRSECGRLKGQVSMALPSEHVLLRTLSLPVVDAEELRGMVEMQLDKISPFPSESMVASYEILERKETSLLVLIAATRADVVDEYSELLKPAGLKIVRVDAAVLGYWKLFQNAGHVPQEGRHVVLLLDGVEPLIIVAQDGLPIVIRSLGDCSEMDKVALASEMTAEVSYTLMSMELEHGAGAPDSVHVWHRGEVPQGLTEELTRECLCTVEVHSLEQLPPLSEGIARRSASGKPGMLDLTPTDWRSADARRRFKKHTLGAAVTSIVLWMVVVGLFAGWLFVERQTVATLKQRRDEWRAPALEVRAMRRRVGAIKRYMSTTHSSLECVREICLAQPVGVDIMGITYHKGESVKLSGEAADVNLVYEFKTKLDASELFENSTLLGPRLDRQKNKQVFDIEIALPGGES